MIDVDFGRKQLHDTLKKYLEKTKYELVKYGNISYSIAEPSKKTFLKFLKYTTYRNITETIFFYDDWIIIKVKLENLDELQELLVKFDINVRVDIKVME